MATKAQRAKQEFIEECEKFMGLPDPYGHFKVGHFRFKIQKTSWRFEHNVGGKWRKVRGRFFTSDQSLPLFQFCVLNYVPQEARMAAVAAAKEMCHA